MVRSWLSEKVGGQKKLVVRRSWWSEEVGGEKKLVVRKSWL